jgi:hypothetical protein
MLKEMVLKNIYILETTIKPNIFGVLILYAYITKIVG